MIWETLPGWCGPAEGASPDQFNRDGVHFDVAMLRREAMEVLPDRVIVEIGSFAGRSAFVLHEAAPTVPLHCFDPYPSGLVEDGAFGLRMADARRCFERAIQKCCVHPIEVGGTDATVLPAREVDHPGIFLHVLDSTAGGAAWDHGAVGLLHVDGLHTYDQVKAELIAWLPHLSPEGVIVFDDWLSYGGDLQRAAWEVLHCSEWVCRDDGCGSRGRGYGRFMLERR